MDNQAETTQRIGALRSLIEKEFASLGWRLEGKRFVPPAPDGKDDIRRSHRAQRVERAHAKIKIIQRQGPALLQEFADGQEVSPEDFCPILVRVDGGSWESDLFRFASLLWSVPITEGYGRRMRYLVKDGHNNKLVGLIALMDPVFNLSARDRHIGWNSNDRKARLYHVMEANVLGAVPPYDRLLCGKLVALAAVSAEIRHDFANKYKGRETIIDQEVKKASLVLITTSSALGRSSIYNRLQMPNEEKPVYRSVGYSEGWGHYQITDATFRELREWLREIGDPYADAHQYKQGPNWRMRAIRRAFDRLGFDGDTLWHGIRRETFVAPLASNYQKYLLGQTKTPKYYHRDLAAMADFFRTRWMIPRSQRIDDWRGWTRAQTWQRIAENCELPLSMILC